MLNYADNARRSHGFPISAYTVARSIPRRRRHSARAEAVNFLRGAVAIATMLAPWALFLAL